jgi:hypothetical protein
MNLVTIFIIRTKQGAEWEDLGESLHFFKKKSDENGVVALAVVNNAYRSLLANWLCFADKIHFSTYVLLAEDKLVYDWLIEQHSK